MLKQAVGKTVTPLSRLASNWLNASPLADLSTPRRGALKLDALSQSKPFKPDVLDAGLLNANLRATDSLNIVDAPDTDNLFALSATRSVKATSNTTVLAGTRNNSIEWGDPLTDQYYWRVQRRQASCA